MNVVASAALLAAEKELTEDTVRPGLIGLLFFVLLFVATYLLWRSMNKQLKKVDAHFSEDVDGSQADRSSTQDQIATAQAALGRKGRGPAPGATNGAGSNGAGSNGAATNGAGPGDAGSAAGDDAP